MEHAAQTCSEEKDKEATRAIILSTLLARPNARVLGKCLERDHTFLFIKSFAIIISFFMFL
jgi:hypothetical protein